MAKNILNKVRFNVEAVKHDGIIQKKDGDVWAPPWMASYARRLLEGKAGIIFASPYVPCKTFSDAALERYNRDIKMFFTLLGSAEKLFVLRDEDEKLAVQRMFRQIPAPYVYAFQGKLDAIALLRGRDPARKAYYNPDIVRTMRDFTDKCASFVIVGTVRMAAIAYEGLYVYLVNRGMHGKPAATEARFMYDDT